MVQPRRHLARSNGKGIVIGLFSGVCLICPSPMLAQSPEKLAALPIEGKLKAQLKSHGKDWYVLGQNTKDTAPQTAPNDLTEDERYVAATYGIPVVGTYLFFPDSVLGGNSKSIAGLSGNELRTRWAKFWTTNNFLRVPLTFDRAATFGNFIFSKDEKKRLIRQYRPHFDLRRLDYSQGEFGRFVRGLDEFQRLEYLKMMAAKMSAGAFGRVVRGPLRILNIKRVRTGRYDFANSSLQIKSVSSDSASVIDYPRILIPYRKGGYSEIRTQFTNRRWRRWIAIPPKQARAITKRLRKRKGNLGRGTGFFGVFGTLKPIADEPNSKRRRARFDLAFDADRVVFAYDPLLQNPVIQVSLDDVSVNLKREQDAKEKAKRLAEKTRKRLRELKRKQKLSDQMVNFAPRTLDVLGITIGMTSTAAKRVVAANLEGAEFRDVRAQGGINLTPGSCDSAVGGLRKKLRWDRQEAIGIARLDGRKTLTPAEAAALKSTEKKLVAKLSPECQLQYRTALKLAILAIKNYPNKLKDILRVYVARQGDGSERVVGVARQLSGNFDTAKKMLREGLIEKYGQPFFKLTGGSAFWFSTDAAHNKAISDKKHAEQCVSRSGQFEPYRFRAPCGIHVGSRRDTMYLVDTDYINKVHAEAKTATKEKKDQKGSAKIKF